MLQPFEVDLQAHTYHSDGCVAPAETVRRAHAAGIKVIAITDHGTIEGWPQFITTCHEVGITPVPGVELTVQHSGKFFDVLGYGFPANNPSMEYCIAQYRDTINAIYAEIIDWLELNGWSEVRGRIRARFGVPFNFQMHYWIEQLLSLHGDSIQRVTDRMKAGGSPRTPRDEFYRSMLPTLEQAAEAAHGAGGVLIFAHPVQSFAAISPDVERFSGKLHYTLEYAGQLVRAGLIDGIEVRHNSHSPEVAHQITRWIDREFPLLLKFGGSDYHGHLAGEHKPNVPFGKYGLTLEEFTPIAERLGVNVPT